MKSLVYSFLCEYQKPFLIDVILPSSLDWNTCNESILIDHEALGRSDEVVCIFEHHFRSLYTFGNI